MHIVVNVLDCNILESEFDPQLHYYIHFQTNMFGKGMSLPLPPPPAMG